MYKWLLLLAACGDNVTVMVTPDAAPPDPVLTQLRALPNVADATEVQTADQGYRYIVLHFRQPVDHHDPASATFLQEVSLLYKDTTSPLIVHTSGYSDYYLDSIVELTALLAANQISIEHRYFGTSRPESPDWSKLTIEQMADDEHAIVTALRTVYTGKAISTGGSKGGMTAVFYRRFYPDDVDGTVPYVAPISFSTLDERYPPHIATLGPQPCHDAIRAVALEMIEHRRAALEAATMAQALQKSYSYTRISLPVAVEGAIEGLEWTFWQYSGVNYCTTVPALDATDAEMFTFLDTISPPSDSDDAQIDFFDAYYYQSYAQLGYPDDGTTYLAPYYQYTSADWLGAFPSGVQPAFDSGAAMRDIDAFVQQSGDRLLFVYGQWDPWTGGAFQLGGATDSLELVQAQGTHNSHITKLAAADKSAALAKLAAWTGVTPQALIRITPEPRVRPVRALRGR
jgi:hypothetical protein